MISLGVCTAWARSLPEWKNGTSFKGFIDVDGKQVYVEVDIADISRPFELWINGLTYRTESWTYGEDFYSASKDARANIIRYDPPGMGQTQLNDPEKDGLRTPYQYQVKILKRLIEILNPPGKINILGLSYGGGLALAAAQIIPEFLNQRVASITLMAPYTEPVAKQDQMIRAEIAIWRTMPLFAAMDFDVLYDEILTRQVFTTYILQEPGLARGHRLEDILIILDGIAKNTCGLRDFQAIQAAPEINAKLKIPINLLVAGSDQYIPFQVLKRFWRSISKKLRASMWIIDGSEHKMTEDNGKFVARLLSRLLAKQSSVPNDTSMRAFPETGKIAPVDDLDAQVPMNKWFDELGVGEAAAKLVQERTDESGRISETIGKRVTCAAMF